MNSSLINDLVELFNFINDPLWNLYNETFHLYEGSTIMGIVILGLMVIVYPSQIVFNFSSMIYITNEMIQCKKWLRIVIGIFVGRLIFLYIIVMIMLLTDYQWTLYYEYIGIFSIPLFLMLGLYFLIVGMIKEGKIYTRLLNKSKIANFPLLKGCFIGLICSFFIDPNVIGIIKMFVPFIISNSIVFSIIFPFVFAFVTFIPVWIFILLSYGFNIDVLMREKTNPRKALYFFGLSLIVIAINIFVLYQ